MNILETLSFEKVQSFHEKHPNVDLVNSYFMGISTTLFPSIKDLSCFESTLAWKLTISSKAIKLGKREINFLAQYIYQFWNPDFDSNVEDPDEYQIQIFEEKIECWFKNFGAMKILFPSFTAIQWFYIGTFVAGRSSIDLIFLLSAVETDFKSQARGMEEYSKGKFLISFLQSNSEALKSLNTLPKIDLEKLRKDMLKSETQKDITYENEEEVSNENHKKKEKAKSKAKGKEKENEKPIQNSKPQRNPKPKDPQDESLYFEALYKVKSAVIEPLKERDVLSTSQRGFPKKSVAKKKEVECSICLEMAEENSMTSLLLCQHSFHLECLQQYLKTRIDERDFPLICPMDKCSLKIFGSEIPKLLEEKYTKKYHVSSFNHFLDTHPNQFFPCPGADCKLLACRKDERSFYCSKCKKTYCIICNDAHDGMTCKEYEITMRFDENDEMFKTFIEGNACQKCSSCGSFIEKNEGCNHMKCRCTYQFCYLCGAKWKTCPCAQGA